MWVPQTLSVVLFYFELPVTKEEFFTEEEQEKSKPSTGSLERHSTMSFRAKESREVELAPASTATGYQAVQPVLRTTEDDCETMRPVPWTAESNPEGRANFISRLFYMWMSPLFKYAHKHTLEEADVWDLREDLR